MIGRKPLIIYTAITSNYETLKSPTIVDPKIRYVCFTDQINWHRLINDTVWELREVPHSRLDATRSARRIKLLPHIFLDEFGGDFSFWIDGNVDIVGDAYALADEFGTETFVGFKHPYRNCIYEEAIACIEQHKEDPKRILDQMKTYRDEGYPRNRGLTETNVLLRKHQDSQIVRLMESWWREVSTRSSRDQLSLFYCLWKANMNINTFGDTNARGSSEVFRVREGWRTTPTKSKFQIFLDKHVNWRLKR